MMLNLLGSTRLVGAGHRPGLADYLAPAHGPRGAVLAAADVGLPVAPTSRWPCSRPIRGHRAAAAGAHPVHRRDVRALVV
ncbi:hypothetical protein QJS66_16350 [Kocuria rhizophila]|nr:hypothetical protein QJS66_16350 [Kocuria rhizophila]